MNWLKSSILAVAATASLGANAGLLTIAGGADVVIPANNAYFADGVTKYNIGGDLSSTKAANITYTYLAAEAGYYNTFTAAGNTLGNKGVSTVGSSFTLYNVMAGLLDFTFATNGSWTSPAPGADAGSVANGANVTDLFGNVHSFATLFNYTYKGKFYDAILVFDDTGPGRLIDGTYTLVDDDNHDDLVIGLNIVAVPAPAAVLLMGLGLLGLGAARRRS